MKIIYFIFVFLVCSKLSVAEVIKLQSGRVIDGVIIKRTASSIEVDVGGGQKEDFPLESIKYIKGEHLDRGSPEYYGILMDAMNEKDTSLEGWKVTDSVKIQLDNPGQKHFEQAMIFGQQGAWQRAIEELTISINEQYRTEESFYHRGNAYYNLANFSKAIDDYTKLINLLPDNSLAYSNRGECYRKLGELNSALSDLEKSIQLDPRNDLSFANRALTHYGLGHTELAIRDFGLAIELNSRNPMYYVNRGQFYTLLHKYDEALSDIESAKLLGWQDTTGLATQILNEKNDFLGSLQK